MKTKSIYELFDFLKPEIFTRSHIPEIITGDVHTGVSFLKDSGFVVIRNCFCPSDVNNLRSLFDETLMTSNSELPRITGYRKLEKNKLSAEGHMTNALMNIQFEDPSRYTEKENLFTSLILRLITKGIHIQAIQQALGCQSLELMTWNLFHSVTPGTLPHQDCVFFNPKSKLCEIFGVWIALEDIRPESSPLYVQRYSHVDLQDETKSMSAITTKYREYFREKLLNRQNQIVAPLLRAGDCIIWDSRTVHGSLVKTNPSYSRLSITAHFKKHEKSIVQKLFSMKSLSQLSATKRRLLSLREIKAYNITKDVRLFANKKMANYLDLNKPLNSP